MIDCGPCATWFLVQFKPNSLRIVERNLTRQVFHTFLALHEETRRADGKLATRMRPLFLGYLFVAFDITTDGWRKINFRHVIEPNRYVRKTAKIKVSAP